MHSWAKLWYPPYTRPNYLFRTMHDNYSCQVPYGIQISDSFTYLHLGKPIIILMASCKSSLVQFKMWIQSGIQTWHLWKFWTMYNWPFSDLEHFYYTWFAPSYSETISFGVVVKSTIRAFRKHILYIPLLVFVHHTGLQMQKNDKKWCFYTFSFFWNHPVNFQAPLLILSNYSVNLVCLGPVS